MKPVLNLQSAALAMFSGKGVPALALSVLLLSGSDAFAASPDFDKTTPRGAQRGQEVSVTFHGRRISDAEEILFHYPGIEAKDLEVVDNRKVKATLAIAPDCRLGEHHLRIRCRSGTSYARNFWVSQFPNVAEEEPNDDFEKPQKIDLDVTVEARVKPEENDYYEVTAKKGQRLSVEIEGLRINNDRRGNRVAIDPYVAILDQDRFKIASADGSALLDQESIVSVEVPEDGKYVIEIRDAAFQGNGHYRAHIGTFPRPTAVYPAGGQAGSKVKFTFLGDPKGKFEQTVALPEESMDQNGEFGVFGERGGQFPPSPNPVRLSDFGNVLEKKEPNDNYKEATSTSESLPLAFNGILQEEGDQDYFEFTAKKNQRFTFQVFANDLGSPVDPVLNVYRRTKKGGLDHMDGNDDSGESKDSKVDFKAPADGKYYVRVREMLSRGGKDYVYRVESLPSEPEIEVTMPTMQRRDLQERKQFDVPRGSYYAMLVNVRGRGVSGDLAYDFPKLPKGVSLVKSKIPESVNQFPILLRADEKAPVEGGMYEFFVKTTERKEPLRGKFVQPLDLVRGPQNATEYYTPQHDRLPISVVEELPFRISIEQPKVPLVRNGKLKLKVKAHREKGFEEKIRVRFLWKPPGISSRSTMVFDSKQDELEYELNANGNAKLAEWDVTMLAETTGGDRMVTAAPFVTLSVEEPFVDMSLNMTTTTQGSGVDMLAEVENLREFAGKADVKLFGLPAHAKTPLQKIEAKSSELRFPIEVSEKTPTGKHKNLFCTVTVTKNGQPIVHRVGQGGMLRVDPKPKKPDPKAKKSKKKVAKNESKKKEKTLSRLEQLRLEAKKETAEEKK